MKILNAQPDTMEWRVYRSDTSVLTLVIRGLNDEVLDLTDWVFTGQVRDMPRSENIITTLTIDKNEDVLTISLDTSELEQINYFDIEGVNEEASLTSTILSGTIFVEEDVTR